MRTQTLKRTGRVTADCPLATGRLGAFINIDTARQTVCLADVTFSTSAHWVQGKIQFTFGMFSAE